ncbi:hypothetical protein DSCA_27700 [Desulfosarcina alkanivorans]|uniref:Uncharacterized protein n=1 Tax=Desulfosarcina alkanivorans TaxID=571177 RepID=A0A5K7YKZ3_9BACT|nr:hypothetical protein DSCA_27700 [Desulfosarcina alkanivorans]
MKGDERISGDSDFVAQVLDTAREAYHHKQLLRAKGIDTDAVARYVADLFKYRRKTNPGARKKPVDRKSPQPFLLLVC